MSDNWVEDSRYKPIPIPERFELTLDQARQRADDFYALMKKRHSIRDFSDKDVPRDIIETCLLTAGLAPNGANKQPWHFAVVGKGPKRTIIRQEAEKEEREFYNGRAGQEWLETLSPLGTNPNKPFLEIAPWLIVVFAQRWEERDDGSKLKNYYVPESCGIACGMLVTALHNAGLVSLTHTPSPMGFLNQICERPENEKALMIVVAGYPADDATIPEEATHKKTLAQIASFLK